MTANILDRLWDTKQAIANTLADMEAERAEVLGPLQAHLSTIEATYAPILSDLQNTAGRQEAEARALALNENKTIEGDHLKITLIAGRETVDAKKLRGYGAAHPEVLYFITTGNPTTRLVEK